MSNIIKAIVGGQKVITQLDVERKAGGPAEKVAPAILALAQKKLETDALLVMSIKNREGYVEPAGVPELLLKRELKSPRPSAAPAPDDGAPDAPAPPARPVSIDRIMPS